MKKNKSFVFLSLLIFVLSACSPVLDDSGGTGNSEGTEAPQNSSNVVTRNQLGADYYRPALDEEGRYLTSKNRGITLNLNSGINISLFEKDLMRLSQESFPTDEYFMQEGQKLPGDLVNTWVGRESEDNPEGLNPPETGDDDDRAPNYLNSILEFDFFTETDDGLQLSGVSIGLAMNSIDYYPAYQYGPTLEQEISSEEVLSEGQKIADEVVRRMREMDGLEDIPIFVGIYEQAAQDALAGGVYVAGGQSTDGSDSIQSWDTLNENRLIFPLEGSDSAEGNAFANFQSEVEDFFPNISGVTGQAHYVDDQLQDLTIEIMTQFYGEAEMVSFTQYLKQSATTYLPGEIDVEIVVESPGEVEAFLKRERTDSEYFSYVFD